MKNKPSAIKKKLEIADETDPGQILLEKEYSGSRAFFIAEESFATAIVAMTSGVVISGILKFLGASDSINGVISGIPVCAGILLIFLPLIFRNIEKVKLTVMVFALLHRLLFSLLLAIPLIISGGSARLFAFVIIYAAAYMIGTFLGPSTSNWLVSLVPARIKGRYLGLREGAMTATTIVMSLIVGVIIDHMKSIGHEAMGYGICAAFVFVFTVFNLLCLVKIKEPPRAASNKKISFCQLVAAPFRNKPFRKVIILSALWNFAVQIGSTYFAIYYISVLGLNYTYIMLMNVVLNVLRVFTAQYWGRIADKKSWILITKLSLIILGVGRALSIFLNENTYQWAYPIVQIFAGIGWGGAAISMFNILFEYAPQENRIAYISVNEAVSSAVGYIAILIGAAIVKGLGDNTVYIGALPIHIMQFLFLASGALILVTSLFVHKFIKPKQYEI